MENEKMKQMFAEFLGRIKCLCKEDADIVAELMANVYMQGRIDAIEEVKNVIKGDAV